MEFTSLWLGVLGRHYLSSALLSHLSLSVYLSQRTRVATRLRSAVVASHTRMPLCLKCGGRGPGLGAINLVFSDVSDQTRLAAPIDAAPSVHGLPLVAGWIELAELYRTMWLLRLGSKRHGRSRYNKVRSANILCVNQLAVVCRARYSLRMARILRGSGTSQRCALPATPRTRPCTPAHDCR